MLICRVPSDTWNYLSKVLSRIEKHGLNRCRCETSHNQSCAYYRMSTCARSIRCALERTTVVLTSTIPQSRWHRSYKTGTFGNRNPPAHIGLTGSPDVASRKLIWREGILACSRVCRQNQAYVRAPSAALRKMVIVSTCFAEDAIHAPVM